MGVGYGQIVDMDKPFYPYTSIIIKQNMAWANCACPHGCRKPVIPSWTEKQTIAQKWWYDAGLTQETLNQEIEAINKRASEFMVNQNWKNKGYIVGYICYVLSLVISMSAIITIILLGHDPMSCIYVLVFIMLSIMFINLAVCEWHKYLWNICLKDIENNIVSDLNARYSEYKFVWSVHSRMVQHGIDNPRGKGSHAYKRKYVDITCVGADDIAEIYVVGQYTVVYPNGAVCRREQDISSDKLGVISIGTIVTVDKIDGRRCRISQPFQGWISSHTNKGDLILDKEENQITMLVQ
eukprot:364247_1